MEIKIIDQFYDFEVTEGDQIVVDGNLLIVRTVEEIPDEGDAWDVRITAENLSDAVGETGFVLNRYERYGVWMIV